MIALIMKFLGSKLGGIVSIASIVLLIMAVVATLYFKNKAARLEKENVMLVQNLTVANLTINQSNLDKVAIVANLDAYIKANDAMEKGHAAESEMLRKANDRKVIENIELKKKLGIDQKLLDEFTVAFANLQPGEDSGPLKLKIKEMQDSIDLLQTAIQGSDCLRATVPAEIFKMLCEGCQ